MARIRLTKKAIVLITVFLVLLIGGGAGYLIWTVNNQSKQVAPENSSAGGETTDCSKCNYETQQSSYCNSGILNVCKINGQIVYRCNYCEQGSGEGGDDCKYCSYTNTKDECHANGHKGTKRECTINGARDTDCDICEIKGTITCCDGTIVWVYKDDPNSWPTACKDHDGYGNCNKAPCGCQSYSGCGVNCHFDQSVQKDVDAKAKANCGERYMAFCEYKGNKATVTIKPAGACWDKRDICKNPTAYVPCKKTNKCDTGGIDTPVANTSVTKGQVLKISGWAADSDGIDPNSIVVKIDNTTVGKASVTGKASGHSEANAVAWAYNWTVTADPGTHSVTVSWKDKKGVGGSNCTATRSFIVKPATNNVCDTGGIDTPANNTNVQVGDVMHISGWAADSDGIDPNSIEISIDGQVVGHATVSGPASGHSEANAVAWSYNWTVAGDPGSHNLVASWRDALGNVGAGCTATRTFNIISSVVTISKTASYVCSTDAKSAKVTYVITLTNYTEQSVTVKSVIDTLDNHMPVNWIDRASISPSTGVVTDNGIEWQLGNASLASGASRTFSYVVNIPNTSFGSFTNSVKATLTNSSVNAYKTISVVCNPNTGLFDSTERKLVAGVILIIMGTLYVVLDKDRRYSLRLTEAGLSIFTYEGKVKKTRKEFAKKFKQKR